MTVDMRVEASGALPMLTGLWGGHVGVVWWVWFGRTVRIRACVHTFVHTMSPLSRCER